MSKEYIEREALKEDVKNHFKKLIDEGYVYDEIFESNAEISRIIGKQPTADVVEVVRCRECINLICVEVKDGCVYKCRRNKLTEVDMHLNGYCCHGEKRIRSE